ncbi:hypothetical protein [Halodesulfovibrio aestuarii]|uniref:hypothetical protein n=1 Tax=Halodesulfovibrio aestuarii TaxID=126333 RepID=UPI0004280DA2
MLWRRGWLVNSLKYHVEKDIRETIYNNSEFKKLKWSSLQRLVVWGAQHLILANVVIASVAVCVAIVVSRYYELLSVTFPSLHGLASLVEFQGEIFAVQATLVGLIFPLVIAFISILLEGKSAKEAMWQVYKHSSGFMLVGYSSLWLLLSYVGMKMAHPWLSAESKVAAACSVVGWFGINLILSIWFLRATMRFLSERERMEVLAQYGANEVLLKEIRVRLAVLINLLANQKNFLPSGRSGWYAIDTQKLSGESYILERSFGSARFVTNVWYRILNLAVYIWYVQLSNELKKEQTATLSLLLPLDGYKHKKLEVAQTDSEKINVVSSFLIRNSLVTAKDLESSQLDFESYLGAMFDTLEKALSENNSRLFGRAKIALVSFYQRIELAMAFTNDARIQDNWLLLSGGRMFSRSLLSDFIVTADDITKQAISRLYDDTSYYDTWCYFFIHCVQGEQLTATKVITDFVDGHYRVWLFLMEWLNRNGVDSSQVESIQEKSIKRFVSSWENWRYTKRGRFSSINEDAFNTASEHLECTSMMIISSMTYLNLRGMRWAIDVLINWYELFIDDVEEDRYLWNSSMLTRAVVESEDRLLEAVVADGNYNEVEAAAVSLTNYWTDIRCLSAAVIMFSAEYFEDETYKDYVLALLREKRLEPTGTVDLVRKPIASAQALVSTYLRQILGYNVSGGYSSELEKLASRLVHITEPEWVSGRVYMSSRTQSDSYLCNYVKVLGVGLSQRTFAFEQEWKNVLLSDALIQREKESLIYQLRQLMSIDESLIKYVCYQFCIDANDVRKRKEHFINSIEAIIAEITSDINQRIVEAEVDGARLEEIALAASDKTFTKEDGPIPISLFTDVKYVRDIKDKVNSLNVSEYNKSSIAKGIDASRAVNEGEWVNSVVRNEVAVVVFRKLLGQVKWLEEQFEVDIDLLSQVIEDSKPLLSAGLTPVLFVGASSLIRLLDANRWGYAKVKEKLPFKVKKFEQALCKLEDVEVYRHPFREAGFSLLVPKELFKAMKVKQFAEEQYVKVFFEAGSNGVEGTLGLSFGVECKFKGYECFKYLSAPVQGAEK